MAEEIKNKNAEIDVENKKLANLQSKIVINISKNENTVENGEIAVVRLNNRREDSNGAG